MIPPLQNQQCLADKRRNAERRLWSGLVGALLGALLFAPSAAAAGLEETVNAGASAVAAVSAAPPSTPTPPVAIPPSTPAPTTTPVVASPPPTPTPVPASPAASAPAPVRETLEAASKSVASTVPQVSTPSSHSASAGTVERAVDTAVGAVAATANTSTDVARTSTDSVRETASPVLESIGQPPPADTAGAVGDSVDAGARGVVNRVVGNLGKAGHAPRTPAVDLVVEGGAAHVIAALDHGSGLGTAALLPTQPATAPAAPPLGPPDSGLPPVASVLSHWPSRAPIGPAAAPWQGLLGVSGMSGTQLPSVPDVAGFLLATAGAGAPAGAVLGSPRNQIPTQDAPAPAPSPAPSPAAVPGAGGITFFVPVAALIALLALSAPATRRRFRRAGFLQPSVPFVCALERPG